MSNCFNEGICIDKSQGLPLDAQHPSLGIIVWKSFESLHGKEKGDGNVYSDNAIEVLFVCAYEKFLA